jgi:hypothetical protein
VVYKVNPLAEGTETEFALSLHKPPGSQDEDAVCNFTPSSEKDLGNGWTKFIVEFDISSDDNAPKTVRVGLVIAVVNPRRSQYKFQSYLENLMSRLYSPPPSPKKKL